MKKRSITIAGHRTSITLEEEFWIELNRLAEAQKITVAQLIARLDSERVVDGKTVTNLSSTCRIYVLRNIKPKS
jgi:predicted DNA-binding ribbon-helix-helix protein